MKVSYEKMDPITHIHKRPDMYLGTLTPKKHDPEWVLEGPNMEMIGEPVYSDGLWRIFLEPISNVVDNVWRSRQLGVECKKIRVEINPNTAEVVIWNDGLFIPIEINPETKLYNPELIFGNLLTSSNYNDEEDRLSSGRNGLGVKLTNVFSTHFQVECGDPERNLVYSQQWSDHMRQVQKPKIRKKKTTAYTCVRFTPDLSLFNTDKLDDTIMGLFRKTCADMSLATNLPVLLNQEKIHIHSLKEYANLFHPTHMIHWNNDDIQRKKGESLEVVICPSPDNDYHEVAFVNGIYNKEGGAHADAVSTEFFKAILQKINKNKENVFSVKDIKQHFMIFVKASLVNPSFSNQNKTRLQSPTPKVSVDTKHIQQVCSKWGFMEKMNELMRAREFISLKKTERKRGYKRIEGLDHANKSGTKDSKDCTLILCEGLSAKTYAVKGIQKGWDGKKGRDYFAIYPLRGKVLNVRNANTASISANKEIASIIQALNLKHKTDYTNDANFGTLSYGKVMIITDADVDGLHIASLLINMFHVLFPSLLRRQDFLFWMMTPVAKIFPTSSHPITFYNDFEYQQELEKMTGKNFKVKYYKGLGSSNDDEIKDTFGVKVVSFHMDNDTCKNMEMVFSKSNADDRKRWMEDYNPKQYETPNDRYPISDFVNQEHIRFSIDDCKRSIPSLFDGLKLSQRKIMYTVFKRNLVHSGKSMKVAQLAGSVAELSCYHHGEQNLLNTIIGLAQDFVGSLNNVPLLFPDGQHGCLHPDTPILMWDGSIRPAKHIVIGDKLVGDDGKPRHVLQLTNGQDEMYQIETIDKTHRFVCNSQHILTLYHIDLQCPIDISVQEYIHSPQRDKMLLFTNPHTIQWEKQSVPYDPYEMGVLFAQTGSIIPIDYMINDTDTRLQLLKGFLSCADKNLRHIRQSIQFLARSLGFQQDLHPFTLTPLGLGPYCGWQIDGNERFLLGDFVVTHNSRLQLGRDAANGRYIHTKMMKWTRTLFPEQDDNLLTFTLDDGQKVEPDYYVPIIPLILVNGIRCAIGSGWSSNIPSYDTLQIVATIRNWLKDKNKFKFPEMVPHFNGFKGEIEKMNDGKYKCRGILGLNNLHPGKKKQESHRVVEIPIDCSIDKYKEFLEGLLEEKKIKSFKNFSSPDVVDFHFTPSDHFKPTIHNMNLTSDIHLTNIVLFNDERIQKYDHLEDIFLEFCRKRLKLYGDRKNKLIMMMQRDLEQETTRLRFIDEVMRDKIVVFKKTEDQIIEQLKKASYLEQYFPMLMAVPIRSFTKENVIALQKKVAQLQEDLAQLQKTSLEDMWNQELDTFVNQYQK